VWSYDFVEDRTHEGRKYRMLNVIDEFTHEALAIRIDRKLDSTDVVDVLTDLFILHGVPENMRSDNGPEFIAKVVRKWIADVGARTAYIAPGSPWENGFVESFNSPARRASERRDILHPRRGQDHRRELAAPLQHRASALLARIQATGAGSLPAAIRVSAHTPFAGPTADDPLTFKLDPSVGADQITDNQSR
jgi:transposase InsO family protein